jgi:hypothetical protein
MQRTHQRRPQRVAYATSVRVHPADRRRPFDGRIINLSRSGVLVESPQRCPIGTEVVCEIPLPGGDRQLAGSVARFETLSSFAVALGIRFTDLGQPDEDMLSAVVGEDDDSGSRLVQVRFEGMREPVRTRARLTADGLRLITSFPFLRVDSPVEVTFLSGDTRLHSQGSVRDVQLEHIGEDGAPRVAVDLFLPPGPQSELESEATAPAPISALEEFPLSPGTAFANGSRKAVALAVETPAADAGSTIPEQVIGLEPTDPNPPAAVPAQGSGPVRRRRAVNAGAAILIGTGLGVAIGAILALLHRGGPSGSPAEPPPAIVHSRPTLRPAGRQPAPEVASVPASTAAAAGAPSLAPIAPPPAVAVVAAIRPAAPALPPPLPEGTPGPTVATSGAETTALVPVSGSTEGMTHRSLFHPRGLSVNLPQARAVLAPGVHLIERDGLRLVWIRDRGEAGLQIRFIFTSPPPDERLLELEEDAVRIRVRRHEQVAGESFLPNL